MSLPTGRIINRNLWTEIPIPDSVIDVAHHLSCRNNYGLTYTYNDDVIIPDDYLNNPHDDYEDSDDKNESYYVDIDSISIMDSFNGPPNTDDSSYVDPIAGVEDNE